MKSKIQNHIGIVLLFIVGDTYLSAGIFGIYLLHFSITLPELSTIVAGWLLLSSLGSIPAGVFADRMGNKRALLLGLSILTCGTVLFAMSGTFLLFLISYALMGLGSAFLQGVPTAYLFALMKESNEEVHFKEVVSGILFRVNLFAVVASIFGGILFAYHMRAPFILEALLAGLAFVTTFFLPSFPTTKISTPIFSQLKEDFLFAMTTKHFGKIFLFSALMGSISITVFQYLQPLYSLMHIPEAMFGFLAAGAFLLRGIGSWYAAKLAKAFSVEHYLVLHAAVFSFFLLLLQGVSNSVVVILIIAVLYFLRGLYVPTIGTFINESVPSSKRATILSLNSQLLFSSSTLTMLGLAYFSKGGLIFTFYSIGIISLLLLVGFILGIRRINVDIE